MLVLKIKRDAYDKAKCKPLPSLVHFGRKVSAVLFSAKLSICVPRLDISDPVAYLALCRQILITRQQRVECVCSTCEDEGHFFGSVLLYYHWI
jgi:hypothetical protein